MTATLVDDYTGEKGEAQLLRSLQLTQLIGDNRAIAEEVSKVAALASCHEGEVLIQQDDSDDDLHLLLRGRVQVLVDGREVAVVNTGGHVGELALIDPRAYRCASAVALRDTVTARLTQQQFIEVANRHPILWRRAAQILGDRLREFNRHVYPPNPRPWVFFGCADRELGYQLESRLRSDRHIIKPFLIAAAEGVFPAAALAQSLGQIDFVMLARRSGDLPPPAGRDLSPRDVLHYLCGASAAAVGPERTILIEPDDEEAGLLSTRFGIRSLVYADQPESTRGVDLDAVAVQVHDLIGKMGVKSAP